MLCSACGTDNDAGRRFCDTCGAPLTVVCRICGSSNRPTARFCGDCGTAVEVGAAPASAAPRPAVLEAALSQPERRLVSVLFVDLVGYTTLADGWDPEQARDLLTRYFETARDIVARYGGTIEKFIGDAVMAVWGAPTAHEDDAERAVRAALELVDRVPGLEPSLRARAGVLTGEAAVDLRATDQGIVAGDLVNTASRLQSVAPPGAVLVDEATERTASKAIAFEPAGEQVLKGKASPVPAYRAMRVVAERGGRNRSETLEAPFTGRDTELRLLKDLYASTARERRIGLVSLTGQAGRRQEPGGVGVREVPRRPRRHGPLARRSFAGVRRRHHLLGPRRDGPRSRRPPRDRRRADDAPQDRRLGRRVGARRGRAPLGGDRAPGAARRRAGAVGWSREPVRRVADVLRADQRRWHGRRARLRRPALGGPRAARLHRPPAGMVHRRADPHRHPGPTRSSSSDARRGEPAGGTSSRSTSIRSPTRRSASCSAGS